MPQPLKRVKSGNFEACIWENEKDTGQDGIVTYKSVSVRKTWKDSHNTYREQKLNLRKQDVGRILVLLRRVQEHLILEEEEQ